MPVSASLVRNTVRGEIASEKEGGGFVRAWRAPGKTYHSDTRTGF